MKQHKNIMHKWYEYLFDSRKNNEGFVNCFECGNKLHEFTYKEISTCYSHILSQKRFPELKGQEFNVKIVCPDCHNLYTIKPSNAVNQYNEYLKLKEKYGISKHTDR